MAKQNLVARTKEDLKRELNDQLDILRVTCAAFDNGTEAAGKTIATVLRVLLYSYKRSRGLLDQLGYRTGKFVSSSEEFDESNIAPRFTLLLINVLPTQVSWTPLASVNPYCRDSRRLSFADWWGEIVVMDGLGKRFSRMDLVMNVADKDGGAHVDPDLVDTYMDLTRGNSIGYEYGGQNIPFVGRPVLACMRQIAHELIATLNFDVLSLAERTAPVIPPEIEIPTALEGQGQNIKINFTIPDKYKGMKNLQTSASMIAVKRVN